MSTPPPPAPKTAPAPLLPPDGGRDRPLFMVSAILVFLACLSALGALGAWRAADGWTAELAGEMTVQILPGESRDADADAREAAALIAELPGVARADARSREASEALLRPWLGSGTLPEDLPVPRLIAVRLEMDAPATAAAVEGALAGRPYAAIVDDHERWAEAVARASGAVRWFAVGLLFLVGTAAAAVIAFAARASLAARWDVAEALYLVGATDAFTAQLFERRFFALGLKAGLAGAVAAALAAAALAMAGGSGVSIFFLPTLSLGWAAALIPPAAAILSALISAFAARASVASALRANR